MKMPRKRHNQVFLQSRYARKMHENVLTVACKMQMPKYP